MTSNFIDILVLGYLEESILSPLELALNISVVTTPLSISLFKQLESSISTPMGS